MILPLATFMALAASCAPQVDAKTLAKGAKVESGFETLSLNDNTLKREFHPHDKDEAVNLAHKLLSQGHNLDLGIMQNNSVNFGWLGLTVEDAFDPCHSISAGATELLSWSRYNTGSPKRGFSNGYVSRIMAAGAEIKGASPDADSVQVAQAAPELPHDWNVFPDEDDSATPTPAAVAIIEPADLQQTPANGSPPERSPAATELAHSPPLGVPPTPQPENDSFPVTLAGPVSK